MHRTKACISDLTTVTRVTCLMMNSARIRIVRNFTAPASDLDQHAAALGLVFYTGQMDAYEYSNRLFITQHGSWNRSEKSGYRILVLDVQANGKVLDTQVIVSGWLQNEEDWGRPNDVLVMPDGALLVSDRQGGSYFSHPLRR